MANVRILIAGFGGQGILFSGKFLASKGLVEGKHVSWLPSYGPEMRGGTANCSVTIDDKPVDSPIISTPDVLIVMNLPSLVQFQNSVVPGGKIFVDSSLINYKVERTDVDTYYIPASQIALENSIPTLANMIMTGLVMKNVPYLANGDFRSVLEKVISARRQNQLESNLRALELGASYQ